MNRFTPLFSQLVDSSVWTEPYFVRVLWMTLLAKKDSDHVVRGTAFNIARWANMTEEEVLKGLHVLSSPDRKRIEKQEHEGRRIRKVEDGWEILNGDKYEKMMRKVAEQARKAKWAREHRARLNGTVTHDTGGYEKGVADVTAEVEHGAINEPGF